MVLKHIRSFIIVVSIVSLFLLIVFEANAQRKKPSTKPPTRKTLAPAPAPAPAPKKPIAKDGLLDALRIGGLSSRELVQEIKSRGVSFEVSGQTETELRVAGAPTAVIDAARANYKPLIGRLNVTATVPGTEILVSSVGSFSNQITDLKLQPGRYTITGNKLGHRNATTEVEIKLFETSNVNLSMFALTPEEMMTLASQSYEKGQYKNTISLTRMVIAAQPNNIKANSLMGTSLYANGDYDEAVTFLTKSILAGNATSLPILHRHGGSWSGKTLCSGRLTFLSDSVEFYSTDFPSEGFVLPYAKLVDFNVKDRMRLNLKVMVKLPKNRKETEEDYNYYSTDAVATGKLITCDQCLPKMRVILQLLRRFKTGS